MSALHVFLRGGDKMANEPRTIKVTADSELGKLVDEARRHPVLLGTVSGLTVVILTICGLGIILKK
jgi:hypothetical protein